MWGLDPWVLFALGLYAAIALAPLLAFACGDLATYRLGVAAVIGTAVLSLICFMSTPDGALQDSLEYARPWEDGTRPTEWFHLFSAPATAHGLGWNVLPLGLAHGLTQTWLIERIIGLGWGCVLALGVVALPLGIAPEGLPITLAILAATPAGLWIQRHHMGTDLLVQQLLLITALGTRWTLPAGVLAGLGGYNYLACCCWLAYPLLFAWRRWRRLLIIYGVAAAALVPAALTLSFDAVLHRRPDHWLTAADLRLRAGNLLCAFWDTHCSQAVSWNWSYPGGQLWPQPALVALLAGIVFGRQPRLLLIGLLGFLPALFSDAVGAASHREMMALLPLALVAGGWVERLPLLPEGRWACSITTAAMIVATGMTQWLDAGFWDVWLGSGLHGF